MALGVEMTAGDCAEYMLHGMLGTEQGWRCVSSKGEAVKNKTPGQEEMIKRVWEHTETMLAARLSPLQFLLLFILNKFRNRLFFALVGSISNCIYCEGPVLHVEISFDGSPLCS